MEIQVKELKDVERVYFNGLRLMHLDFDVKTKNLYHPIVTLYNFVLREQPAIICFEDAKGKAVEYKTSLVRLN